MRRDSNGMILCDGYYHRDGTIMVEQELYYYKYVSSIANTYNELIASEIAKQFGIKCADTDIGTIDSNIVILSKNFVMNSKFIKMDDILKEVYDVEDSDLYNNIEDVSYALKKKYNKDLKDDITKIFLFDMLIANGDRHSQNYGILEKDNRVSLAPLFDNEEMLGSDYLFENIYSFGVNRQDYYGNLYANYSILEKFLSTTNDYDLFLEKKKEIINKENIENILRKVESKLNHNKIPSRLREKIKERFEFNYRTINRILKEKKQMKELIKK